MLDCARCAELGGRAEGDWAMTMATSFWYRGLLLLGMWFCAMSCEEGSPSVGSDSHFLAPCQATCNSGFECVCGVCTKQCSGTDHCSPLFPTAECIAVAERPAESACPATSAPAFCDVRCSKDGDCAGLGA